VSGSAPALTVTTNPGTFTMPASDVELRAEFKLKTYPIEVVNDGLGSASADAEESPADATVKLTAVPLDGYQFVRWTVESGGVTLADATANPATFTMPREAVKFKAHFALIPRPPYILHLDPNGRLSAGQWDDGTTGSVTQDNVLFFKQGALVGFTTPSSLSNETWAGAFSSTTFYNPSDKAISSFLSDYYNVPSYDYKNQTPEKNVSLDNYNTAARMKAGQGDPCRLIGLTAAEAQAMAAAGTLTAYNSGFRLQTRAELITSWVNAGTTWTTVNGYSGRWLNSAPNVTSFIPATGERLKSGQVSQIGELGGFWSASASTTGAYGIYFDSTNSEMEDNYETYGKMIRCFKK
jgi:hypothetical protein